MQSLSEEFCEELRALLNRNNIDGLTNTPDFILANHLVAAIEMWGASLEATRKWHGWPTLGESLNQSTTATAAEN